MIIDRGNNQVILKSSSGEQIQVGLEEPAWIQACENQFLVEYFTLSDPLDLGSITFQKPVLIVACEMWAVGEKTRPARLLIKEGSIAADDRFYFGMECYPGQEVCVSFAEALNELSVTVIDGATKLPLPDAAITISSGLGIQEYKGSFRMPIYAAMQLEYRISLAGYVGKNGTISNFYGNKLEIMYWTNENHTQGEGYTIDLPGNGQVVKHSIELDKE
jgi:hypothetical protein